MKLKGPLVTLAAGVVVAGVLLVLDLNATSGRPVAAGDHATTTAAGTATLGSSGAPATSAPPAPAAPPDGTYAGAVDGSAASVAIAVKGATAIAYVCDGKRAEAWLQGSVTGATFTLTGRSHATLTASAKGTVLTGSVTAAGHTWSFTISQVKPPSGLYRAAANVRQAKVVAGWIVTNGRQVGVVNAGGTESAAPSLDTTSLTAVIDGTSVAATAVDGAPIPLDGQ